MNDPHMLVAVLTLAGAAVLLVTNWIRGDLVAVLVMLTLMLTGVLEPGDADCGLRLARQRVPGGRRRSPPFGDHRHPPPRWPPRFCLTSKDHHEPAYPA